MVAYTYFALYVMSSRQFRCGWMSVCVCFNARIACAAAEPIWRISVVQTEKCGFWGFNPMLSCRQIQTHAHPRSLMLVGHGRAESVWVVFSTIVFRIQPNEYKLRSEPFRRKSNRENDPEYTLLRIYKNNEQTIHHRFRSLSMVTPHMRKLLSPHSTRT